MGLMQLLTVGRSLSEARDRPHRYKLRSQSWPVLVGRSGESEAGWNAEEREAASEDRAGVQAMKTSTSAVADKTDTAPAYPSGRWTLKANPFRSSPSPKSESGSSLQGELVLDNVKPKRNDLSDSDLELVAVARVKPSTSPFGGVAKIATTEVPVAKAASVWQRVLGLWRRGH